MHDGSVCVAHLAFICRHLNEEFLKKHLVLHKQIHNFTLEFFTSNCDFSGLPRGCLDAAVQGGADISSG